MDAAVAAVPRGARLAMPPRSVPSDYAGTSGGAPTPGSSAVTDSDHVSLLSWNVLADTLLQKNVREYAHIPAEWKTWGTRCAAIVEELLAADADVVCLQEVEFAAFQSDFLPALARAGYDGCMQNDKKKAAGHCQGVATFWKTDRFSVESRTSRSRTLVVVLRERTSNATTAAAAAAADDGDGHDAPAPTDTATVKTAAETAAAATAVAATAVAVAARAGRALAVCNVHLEGHPMKSVARVKQLQNSLRDLARGAHAHHGLVVAGDFNCQMQSSACGAYLSFGSCPPGVLEWGHPVPTDVTKVPPHTYQLAAAYASPPAAPNPGRGHGGGGADLSHPFGDFQRFTYCQHAGRPVSGLDQLWHSPATLRLAAERACFASDAQRVAILKTGLPSPANFSDHIPVGVVLRWAGPAGSLPDLRPAAAAGGKGTGGKTARASAAEDPEAEATALLLACPLTPAQRVEFAEATAPVPGMPAKGKPPREALALVAAQRVRRERLFAAVPDEARQVLQRVMKLRKAAKAKVAKSKGGKTGNKGAGATAAVNAAAAAPAPESGDTAAAAAPGLGADDASRSGSSTASTAAFDGDPGR